MQVVHRTLSALLLFASLCACGTAPRPPARPLPFHVALPPLQRVQMDETQGEKNMRFELDEPALAELNKQLFEILTRRSFTCVTGLAPIDTSLRKEEEEIEQIRLARETTEADLLLTLDLHYGTAIYHDISESRVRATPFWWVPGPQYWFAKDHIYGVDLTLTFKLYDLARCSVGEEDRPLELRRWFFSHAVSLDDLELDFVDRSGDRILPYFRSFFTPSTLLSREGPELERVLGERFIKELAETVAAEIASNRNGLIRNDHDYSFYLVTSDLLVERLSPTLARVAFSLDHRRGRSRNLPAALKLFPGGGVDPVRMEPLTQDQLTEAHQDEASNESVSRYRFVRELEVAPDTTVIRLHVAAGAGVPSVREFTLALPEYEDPQAVDEID